MKRSITLLACMLLIGSTYGSHNRELYCIAEQNPHHLYFGTDFFGFQLNTQVSNIKVSGTRFLWGLELGYEYLRPNSFYAGVDLWTGSTDTDFSANTVDGTALSWNQASKALGNLELRGGYTFASCHWFATPFLGLGIYDVFNIDDNNNYGFAEDLPYVAAGIRTKYALNCLFNLGVNLKIFRTFSAEQEFRFVGGEVTRHQNSWGGEIGVPLNWNLGCSRRWDIQFEPYFASLNFSETQNLYGARLLAGYRF